MGGSIGGTGHYVGTQEILSWVAEHTGKMGEEIHDSMELAEQRAKQLDDLSVLKEGLNDILKNGGYGTRAAQMQAFLDQNKDAPNYDDLKTHLQPIIDDLNAKQKQWDACDATKKTTSDPGIVTQMTDQQNALFDDFTSHISTTLAAVDSASEAIKKDDSLAMLDLQDATSKLNQAMQQASNVIQSMNSASMAILGNIRA